MNNFSYYISTYALMASIFAFYRDWLMGALNGGLTFNIFDKFFWLGSAIYQSFYNVIFSLNMYPFTVRTICFLVALVVNVIIWYYIGELIIKILVPNRKD